MMSVSAANKRVRTKRITVWNYRIRSISSVGCHHIFLYQHNAKIPPEVSQKRTENEGVNAYICYEFIKIRFQAKVLWSIFTS